MNLIERNTMILKIISLITGILFLAGGILPLTLRIVSIFTILSGGVGVVLIILPFVFPYIRKKADSSSRSKKMYRIICCLTGLLAVLVTTEGVLMLSAAFPRKLPENSVVVVLGAAVLGRRPSGELSARIQKAAEYMEENPLSICVASGGQGDGEWISEALCIKEELVTQYGISENRILMEDQSRNTIQNLENTAELIRTNHLSEEIVLVTDAYHMYRSEKIAQKAGLSPHGLAVYTDKRLLPSSVIREFCALTKAIILDSLLF